MIEFSLLYVHRKPKVLFTSFSVVICVYYFLFIYFSGLALVDVGEAMRELGEIKDALDMEVKQNFIDPMTNLHEKDLKEIQVQTLTFHTQRVQGKKINKFTTGWRIYNYYLVVLCSIT